MNQFDQNSEIDEIIDLNLFIINKIYNHTYTAKFEFCIFSETK